jgi:hypothetical protein
MVLCCPACRAENTFGPQCRRCRADLSLLAAVEARWEFHVSQARAAAQGGRVVDALTQLDEASKLRNSSVIRGLRSALLLLTGDYQTAVEESVRAGNS